MVDPPETIVSDSPFPEVNVRFDPYTRYRYTASPGEKVFPPYFRYGPWLALDFESEEWQESYSLGFETEFVSVTLSQSEAVRRFPSNEIVISNEQLCTGVRNLIFKPSAVSVPGNYQLIISVYVLLHPESEVEFKKKVTNIKSDIIKVTSSSQTDSQMKVVTQVQPSC
jgi:hypothetical protein